jgi:hypothetical protein
MPWWTWVSLGFFAAVVLARASSRCSRCARMSALQTVGEAAPGRLRRPLHEERGTGAPRGAGELTGRVRRAAFRTPAHRRSTAFSVLTWAIGDMAKTVSRLRSALLVDK